VQRTNEEADPLEAERDGKGNVEHARWLETALITHFKKMTTPGLANKKPGGKPRQPYLRASCTLFLPLEKDSDVEKNKCIIVSAALPLNTS
jgi:hypothetical protein